MLVGWLVGSLVALASFVFSLGTLCLWERSLEVEFCCRFIFRDCFGRTGQFSWLAFICSDNFRCFAAVIFIDVDFNAVMCIFRCVAIQDDFASDVSDVNFAFCSWFVTFSLHVFDVNVVHFQLEFSSLNIHLSTGLEEDDLKSPTQPTAFLCGGVVTSCLRLGDFRLFCIHAS